jgi:4,5:9,10-diseco-3-hydroxy-5,9,17-trioxoandrosta-1(10),2-diene-4-oate hydrolase
MIMEMPHLPKDQFDKVGSINTRYWSIGEKGTEVILVHGLGGFAENWMFNIEALAKHFRVYTLDLVGFGKSDKPKAPYTYNYFATFVHDFMKKMQIKKASFIGHSLGGGTILQFALNFPDKVEKLVIISSAGLGKEAFGIFKLISLPIFGELLTRPSRKGAAKLLKELVYDKTVIQDEIIELWYQMSSLPGAQKAFLKTNRSTTNLVGYKPKVIDPIKLNLHKITAPTLIIWGEQDQIVPLSHAYVAEKGIPNSMLQVFDKCGHVPMVECIADFNSLVIKYLSD